MSVSRSRSLTVRSLHYAKVNKKRKSARADIVEIDDKQPESKDEDDLVADPRGWTQLKSKNLTLEEILDLESDKEVHFLFTHKNYLVTVGVNKNGTLVFVNFSAQNASI